jgi:hypothetical protein
MNRLHDLETARRRVRGKDEKRRKVSFLCAIAVKSLYEGTVPDLRTFLSISNCSNNSNRMCPSHIAYRMLYSVDQYLCGLTVSQVSVCTAVHYCTSISTMAPYLMISDHTVSPSYLTIEDRRVLSRGEVKRLVVTCEEGAFL